MNKTRNCLICYQPLKTGHDRYHPLCSEKLFGRRNAPELPYAYDELKEAAKKIIRSRIAVPGVQAKLSLHLDNSRKKAIGYCQVMGQFHIKTTA